MSKLKNWKEWLLPAVSGAALALVLLWLQPEPQLGNLGTAGANSFSGDVTNSSSSVSTSSAQVLASNGLRQYAILVNDGDNNVYLAFNATATARSGLRLNSNGGALEINSQNLWLGAINAATETGTTTLTILEK